jgi:hypothetical protein
MIACICGFSIEAIALLLMVSITLVVDKIVCWCNICKGGIKKCKGKK